jgi:hypothetical protein
MAAFILALSELEHQFSLCFAISLRFAERKASDHLTQAEAMAISWVDGSESLSERTDIGKQHRRSAYGPISLNETIDCGSIFRFPAPMPGEYPRLHPKIGQRHACQRKLEP